MRKDYSEELTPEIREKMKKNLVYIAMFSVIMLFAGFTSAYIVSMGDSFWLKVPFPSAFWISTVLIGLSSLTYMIAIRSIKKGNKQGLKVWMLTTLSLGIGFVYFQFKGYGQLTDKGIHAVNNHIIVADGRYGDYYEIKMGDSFLEVNGNDYLLDGKKITAEQLKKLQSFTAQFLNLDEKKDFVVNNYGKPFVLYLNQSPLSVNQNYLIKKDGQALSFTDRLRLRDLSMHIRDGRGDFFARGKIGEDFNIYYKGEALDYKNRELYWKGAKLTKYLQLKATETADTATSFLFILTILHLLHIIATLFYQVKMTTRSFSGKFNSGEHLSLRLGAIFWHFLGLLWLYLLLFLLFIH
ncbi:MAG: cytochrome c oxidase subunit 3 [Bacteroidetes bacterium]|nr:cytochrome c oxidase subunit 3 [Bacteroidota bacterium]